MAINFARTDYPFDIETVATGLKAYAETTGVEVYTINDRGEVVISSNGELYMSAFCKYFQEELGSNKCRMSHVDASVRANDLGDVFIYSCPAGLTHWVVPLISKRKFSGALVCGPALMTEPDEYHTREIIANNNLSLNDVDRVDELLAGIQVIDRKRVRHLAELLLIIGNSLNKRESEILEERKLFYEQQAKLSEEIQSIKEKELERKGTTTHEHLMKYYPMEKELTRKVRFGDKTGAKTVLNEILGQIFFFNGGNIELIKARLLELVVVLSRAAVEGGAEIEMILGMNLNYLESFSSTRTVEEMSFLLIKILDRFIDNVFNTGSMKNYQIIQKALEYMRNNYDRDITLEDAANSVILSASYFCTLFKDELGITFTDYLNRIRVEESKKLLTDLSKSLLEIAQEVGFSDQSYFSKVFKKIEGASPGQFRRTGRLLA